MDIDNIKQELQARKGYWPRICRSTGLKYSWITKFAQNRIPNPGYRTLQKLTVYFQNSANDADRRPSK